MYNIKVLLMYVRKAVLPILAFYGSGTCIFFVVPGHGSSSVQVPSKFEIVPELKTFNTRHHWSECTR